MRRLFSICPHCISEVTWDWNEAFDKFGFDDGDGLVMTERVAAALRKAGYSVKTKAWGMHNVIIVSIKRKRSRRELIPATATVGYDNPRTYLPADIVDALDAAFPDGEEVEP